MGDENSKASPERLARLLRQARELRQLSVRHAAEQAGISGTYLSQLEAGKIATPSPRVLHSLAQVYGESYSSYMKAAGYVVPGGDRVEEKPHSRILDSALRTTTPLSEDERNALMEYLAWYRWQRGRPPEKA